MTNKGCACTIDEMEDVLMDFSNISKEEAAKKLKEILKKRDAKRKPSGPSLGV